MKVNMLRFAHLPGWRHTTLPILAGLIVAQILSTLLIWDSNQSIYSQAQALTAAGWLALPAGAALVPLRTFQAAIGGALFFTLTTGAGLVLAAWGALHLRRRLFDDRRGTLPVIIAIWLLLTATVNFKGLLWFPNAFVLLVPLTTGALALRGLGRYEENMASRFWWLPLLVLAALTGLWSTQLNQRLFTAIRDQVLLSNPVGRGVNDFYYRYTLYAAETFRSLDQKTIRTCRLAPELEGPSAPRLTRILAAGDVLALPGDTPVDISLGRSAAGKLMATVGGVELEIGSEGEVQPQRWLSRLSKATDRYLPFRLLTLAGLLLGFPILLFVTVYGLLRRPVGMLTGPKNATLAASSLCLAIGVALFIPMLGKHSVENFPADLEAALSSVSSTRRVAALEWIEGHSLEIADFPAYRILLSSEKIVERYWLARAMAGGRDPQSQQDLLRLLDDPHPNVVCQALYALGKRGDPQAIEAIKEKLMRSDHWYTQWYGYRALKDLGWRQKPSN
jgi:hypothetical protein